MSRPSKDLEPEPPTPPLPPDHDASPPPPDHSCAPASPRSVLWKLYLSHSLSTWNARTFEFAAVIFLAAIFPGTLFYTSCYALIRAFAAFVFSSAIGKQVDSKPRLSVIRHSIVWQRVSVAASCGVLLLLVKARAQGDDRWWVTLGGFVACVVLAGVEKLAFVGNTVAVERDWVVVVAEGTEVAREDLNGVMRRIDLVGKLVAPLGVSVVEGWVSMETAIWVVLGQNALSVVFEYFAIAQVYAAVPALATRSTKQLQPPNPSRPITPSPSALQSALHPWKSYFLSPAFLPSFSLALLYFTVLGFGSQLTTYLLTLGFSPLHVSLLRLLSVTLELTATCLAPLLMRRIGPIRAGLWFLTSQLLTTLLAITLFTSFSARANPLASGTALVGGVILSRVGLWGFDLCAQFLVQEDAAEESRGAFSAVEASLQNGFELCSFAVTLVWSEPGEFGVPVMVSGVVVGVAAGCFAAFVRRRRGHLVHVGGRCLGKRGYRDGYRGLPTIQEEEELEERGRG